MCHGADCSVIFSRVSFESCCLVVRDGASVTLDQPKFKQMTSQAVPAGLSIFVHGADTTVGLQGGSIQGGLQGVTVQVLPLPTTLLVG